jgi:ABC-type uncharacterized transport system permease subunit
MTEKIGKKSKGPLGGFKAPVIPRPVVVGLSAVILGLIAGAILMGLTGNNPFEGYQYLFKGGLMSVEMI